MPRGIKGSGPYGKATLRDRDVIQRSNGQKPAKPVFELVKALPPDPPRRR